MAERKTGRAAAGSGNIRQRSNGKWEARYTFVDELGQTRRASVYAATQKDCRKKLTEILKTVDDGTYRKAPKRFTLAEWLEEWLTVYCVTLKPSTVTGYRNKIDRYIVPSLGASDIKTLTPMQIQRFCNRLSDGYAEQKPLSPKTVQNIHGILHTALKQAVIVGQLANNPSDNCRLPTVKRPELKPIMDDNVTRFLQAIQGDQYERLFIVTLFTGLRQSEVIGLQWADIDLTAGLISVRRQLQKDHSKGGGYLYLDDAKGGKRRTVTLAPTVCRVLRAQRAQQNEWRLRAGALWSNEHDLVFTDELGGHIKHRTVYTHFKNIVRSIGLPETRFHDLRHSYAVNALQAGDGIKEIQEQLGHYSSAFTLDVYADVSETMRQQSRDRMEQFIHSVSTL